MAVMRRGFKGLRWFKGFGGLSVGAGAVLVAAVCGLSLSAGVAHGGAAYGGVARAAPGSSDSARADSPAPAPAASVAPAAPAALDPGAVAPAAPGNEADIAYHGHISLWSGRVGVWVEPSNHGPTAVPDATVRLRFSSPLTGAEPLPPGCLRGSAETVLCSTGPMRAAGAGRPIALDLAIAGSPAEVVVNINTSWSGMTGDRNPDNNTHRVLAPATGDKYAY